MINGLAYAVLVITGVGLIWGLVTTARNVAIGWAQLGWTAVAELITLVQSVIAVVFLVGGYHPVEYATTIGYLIGIVLLLPLGTLWAISDRSRFSGAVLAVAEAGVLAMTLRLLVLWGGRG